MLGAAPCTVAARSVALAQARRTSQRHRRADEIARAAIRRGRERARRTASWVALAAGVLIAAALWWRTPSGVAARWQEPGGPARPLPLHVARSVPAQAYGTVQLTDGSRIRVDGPARFHLDAAHGIVVADGRYAIDAVPRRDAPLWLATPHGRVEVLGTRFVVVTTPRRTAVQVHRGTVRVSDMGQASWEGGAGHGVALGADTRLATAPLYAHSPLWTQRNAAHGTWRDDGTLVLSVPTPRERTWYAWSAWFDAPQDPTGTVQIGVSLQVPDVAAETSWCIVLEVTPDPDRHSGPQQHEPDRFSRLQVRDGVVGFLHDPHNDPPDRVREELAPAPLPGSWVRLALRLDGSAMTALCDGRAIGHSTLHLPAGPYRLGLRVALKNAPARPPSIRLRDIAVAWPAASAVRGGYRPISIVSELLAAPLRT
ncbi:MAG: FecR domain-containing protein [Planctomycetota bacterium]